MTTSFTRRFRIPIPDFLTVPWHAGFEACVQEVDRALYSVYVSDNAVAWSNNHIFAVGDFAIDTTTGKIWVCDVAHTSALAPTTFGQDRIAHPTFWSLLLATVASQIENTPAGNIASTNVQDALNELDAEKAATTYVDAADVALQTNISTLDGIAVKHVVQALTQPQKAVALRNIGAAQYNLVNGKITITHNSPAANALTIAVKGLDGNDPSASNPVLAVFPNASVLEITAPLSLVLTAGSTTGVTATKAFGLWFAVANNAGSPLLVARHCANEVVATIAESIKGFPGHGYLTTVAEGGAGGADSFGVSYAASAVANMPFVIVGLADWDNGLATAGNWNVAPDRIALFGKGMAKPGDTIQAVRSGHLVGASVTSLTVPQPTGLFKAITPTRKQNAVHVRSSHGQFLDVANLIGFTQVVRTPGSVVVSVASCLFSGGGNVVGFPTILGVDFPQSTASNSYTVYHWVHLPATGNSYCPHDFSPYANPINGIELTEIMT